MITIALSPSNRELVLCQDQSAIIATVGLYYGDELCRQRYRRQVHKQQINKKSQPSMSKSNPLKSVNFDVKYLHEEMCFGVEGMFTDRMYATGCNNVITHL